EGLAVARAEALKRPNRGNPELGVTFGDLRAELKPGAILLRALGPDDLLQALAPHHAYALPLAFGDVTVLGLLDLTGDERDVGVVVEVLVGRKLVVLQRGGLRQTAALAEKPGPLDDQIFEDVAFAHADKGIVLQTLNEVGCQRVVQQVAETIELGLR